MSDELKLYSPKDLAKVSLFRRSSYRETRPTQLSSEHGSRAKPPAASAESLIVRTAAQPPQGEGSGVVVAVITRRVVVTRLGRMP